MLQELDFRAGVARFAWTDTALLLGELLATGPLVVDEGLRGFVTTSTPPLRIVPPGVQPIRPECTDPTAYLNGIGEGLGQHLVLLLQAGAAALGVWRDGELVRHKVIKKYVVRGNGKAQPAYLASKGKSRYGSRLRLQNARKLLVEVNERLADWKGEEAAFDLLFYSCPVRTWADLFAARPAVPFAKEDFRRIPLDVAVPCLAELERTYRRLCFGRIERTEVDEQAQ